jgi:putative flippase GtrA
MLKNIFNKEKLYEFLRFCLVGLIATCIHYGFYLLLITWIEIDGKLWVNIAYLIGFVMSWLCNLWMTAKITFKTHVSLKRGVGFAVTHAINYLLHVLFLNIFLAVGITEQIAPIPVYCCVVPINFILVRTVFKSPKIQ